MLRITLANVTVQNAVASIQGCSCASVEGVSLWGIGDRDAFL